MRNMNKRSFYDLSVRSMLFVAASFAVFFVFFIILFLFNEGKPIFGLVGSWDFVSGTEWVPTGVPPRYGAWPLIVGTMLVMAGALVIAVPLGIAAAIFISEVATPGVKEVMKATVEILAGIPSVVFGFFGLLVMVSWIRVGFDLATGETWLAGSVILGIMALPTIITVSEDAISSVPVNYREASLAMGATRWQTIANVVFPASLSGVTTGIILGMGRAIGETMAVMMVCGNSAIIPQPITDIFTPIRTITATLGIETGEVARGSDHYHALFGLALILLVITLFINVMATIVLSKLKEMHYPTKKKKGEGSPLRLKLNPQQVYWLKRGLFFAPIIIGICLLVSFFGLALSAVVLLGFLLFKLSSKYLNRKRHQLVAYGLITTLTMVVVVLLGIILYYIISNGIGTLVLQDMPGTTVRPINWEFIFGFPVDGGRGGGIFPAIVGTLLLVLGAIALALPIGIGAAIYLAEYQKEGWLTKVIRAGVDVMNGTPSIVFGLFGFAFLVLYLEWGLSLIAGQVTLAFMVLPTIIRTTEEALKTVPIQMREGSLALGATKWQTIRRVVLPASAPGILTGTVLSIGRAAGETAPIMFTAVVFSQRFLSFSLGEPVMALPYHLFELSLNIPGSSQASSGTALVLLIMVALMYASAIFMRARYHSKIEW